MTRLTAEQVTAEPWKYTADQWQAAHNVKQPWIAEISPMQFAGLGKRGKDQYEAKRRDEWQASADCKTAWRHAVVAAYDAGTITHEQVYCFTENELSGEAKCEVRQALNRRNEEARQARIAQARKDNTITDLSTLKPGDRIYDITGWYGIVTKVNRLTVKYTPECQPGHWAYGRTFTGKLGALQYLDYQTLTLQTA